jgi:uncharacterized protein (TIGR02611 family)
MNGMSPITYSVDFAANACAMTVAALAAARLAGRVATRKVILVGQVAALAAGVAMLVLPGPGWAAIFVGFAILATEFAWARRLLAAVGARARRLRERARTRRSGGAAGPR